MTGNTSSTLSVSIDHKAGDSDAVENAGRVKPNVGRQVDWVHGERWGGDGTSDGGASDLGSSGGGSGGGWREANVVVGAVGAVRAGATAVTSVMKAQASAIAGQAAILADVQVSSPGVLLTMSVFTTFLVLNARRLWDR